MNIKTFQKDDLLIKIFTSRSEMGISAALDFATLTKEILQEKDSIRIIFAAAPSQNEFLSAIAADETIDFSRFEAFHMDEYIGLEKNAPQSFGNFLHEHIFSRRKFGSVYYIDGQNPDAEVACKEYADRLMEKPIDIVCMGIGENGHIAFNDPLVANFQDKNKVKVVKLDEICRQQQVHDGCFSTIDEVPTHAITITIPTLVSARFRFCVVPAPRKAEAVKRMINNPIDERYPCTILRRTPNSILYLDPDSSALL